MYKVTLEQDKQKVFIKAEFLENIADFMEVALQLGDDTFIKIEKIKDEDEISM